MMKAHFFVQCGINLLPVVLEQSGELSLFKITLLDKEIFLERAIIGNRALWKIKSNSEGVDLNKFQFMLPSIQDQISDYLAWREKFI